MKFKRKFVWVWTLKTSDQTTWYGTCPKWAAQPMPEGSVMRKSRMMVVGGRWIKCTWCNATHADLTKPAPAKDEG